MKSLKELYQIGIGPSSSHTMAPEKIAKYLLSKYPDATGYKNTLYGSLALTGKGHGTQKALVAGLLGR
ncbi:MAG: serine dehydratase beta chain, partial [Christensenellales bacterium]